MSQSSAEVKARVLSELMLVQSLIAILPSETTIGELLSGALKSVPGCGLNKICFRATSDFVGNHFLTQCPACAGLDEAAVKNYYPGMMPTSLNDNRIFDMVNAGHLFGHILVQPSDVELFELFEPHIHNLANAVAIVMDNKRQQQKLKEANEKLAEMTIRDHLTGLYNRRYFSDFAPHEIIRAFRHEHPVTLVAIDINQFKRVNDEHGHKEGDRLLVKFSAIAKDALREDVDHIFRFGGDEFVLLLVDCTPENARPVLERINQKFSLTNEFVSLACGLSQLSMPDPIKTVLENEEWLNNALHEADQDMYNNKQAMYARSVMF
jgi:diguanylate cyclase (GGDEF)-like protein